MNHILPLFERQHHIVSIVGMSKNSGKTVTTNSVIEELRQADYKVGITSIGRDGETSDLVTQTQKPKVFLYSGSMVATAEQLFHLSDVRMDVVEVTKYRTPMGRVIISKTLEDGFVQIGGPVSNQEIRAVSQKMLDDGADYVLVDGALDRSSSASPLISDACILATGAAVNRYMDTTVNRTEHVVRLFEMKRFTSSFLQNIWASIDAPVIVDDQGNYRTVEGLSTLLGAGKKMAAQVDKTSRFIMVTGALVTSTLRDYTESTRYYKDIEWIVGDATRIFIDAKDWHYFQQMGVKISVVNEVKLLAVTINPTSPQGHIYDPIMFQKALSDRLHGIPVINVLSVDAEE